MCFVSMIQCSDEVCVLMDMLRDTITICRYIRKSWHADSKQIPWKCCNSNNVTLPVVIYRCEPWSVALTEEHRHCVHFNWMPKINKSLKGMHNRKPEKNNIMVCYMFCTTYKTFGLLNQGRWSGWGMWPVCGEGRTLHNFGCKTSGKKSARKYYA